MVRAACWLAAEVGEGGVFTKEELREAIPGVAQIDRRVRDLRKYGWVIDEARVGAGLVASQQRLTKIGVPVWDKTLKIAAAVPSISAKVREEVFFRDGHACRRCGIAAGEPFDDDPSVVARLTAGHLYPDSLGGKASAADLITTCQRCNESLQQVTQNYATAEQVVARIRGLDESDRNRINRRIDTDLRETDEVDTIWREYRQLPGVERDRVKADSARRTRGVSAESETELASIPQKIREEVFARDGHACLRCGIVAGELFDDDSQTKARIIAKVSNDSWRPGQDIHATDVITLCQRCSAGSETSSVARLDDKQLLVRIQGLGRDLRVQLLRRIQTNTRPADKVDKVWREYKQLPPNQQRTVLEGLHKLLDG